MAVEHHGTWPLNGVLLNLPAKSQAQKAVTSFTSRPFALFTSASSFLATSFWRHFGISTWFHPIRTIFCENWQSAFKPHMSYRIKYVIILQNQNFPEIYGGTKKNPWTNLRSSADPWWPISRTNDFSRHLPRDWNGPTWPRPVRMGGVFC